MINIYLLSSVFFRLLNFAIVIGLGVFWYRRSVRATMLGLRQRKQDRITTLEQENKALQAEQRNVEKAATEQEIEGKEFLRRIEAWRSAVEQAHVEMQNEQAALHDKALKRAAVQEKNWERGLVQQAAIGPTLHNAEKILQQKYSSAKSGSAYMEPILSLLEKRA